MAFNSTKGNSCSVLIRGSDVGFRIEASVIIILASISIFINSLFMHLLRSSTGQMGNDVRALLLNSLIAVLVRATYSLLRNVYLLLLIDYDLDHPAISVVSCSLIELPYGVAAAGAFFCMLAIGANRFRFTKPIYSLHSSTHRVRKNPNSVSKATKLTIVSIWLCALIYYTIIMIGMNTDMNPMCICYYPLTIKPTWSYASTAFLFIVESLILITYAVVFVRNRNMLMEFTLRTRQYSLQQRFHAWANVRTTRMLLPPALVHVILILVVICSISPIRDALETSADVGKLKLILLMQIFVGMDVVSYPLLCILFNEHFRFAARELLENVFKRIFPCECTPTTPMISDQTENTVVTATESIPISIIEHDRQKSPSRASQASASIGKRSIIDYRLPPEMHDHILHRTWEMKPPMTK